MNTRQCARYLRITPRAVQLICAKLGLVKRNPRGGHGLIDLSWDEFDSVKIYRRHFRRGRPPKLKQTREIILKMLLSKGKRDVPIKRSKQIQTHLEKQAKKNQRLAESAEFLKSFLK